MKLKIAVLVFALLSLGACQKTSTPSNPSPTVDKPIEDADHTHLYTQTVKSATCQSPKKTVYTCSCGESFTYVEGEVLEHSYGEWEVQTKAGCETKGVKVHHCIYCNREETAEIDPTGHHFGDWQTVLPASALATGTSARACSACGLVEEKEIAPLGSSGIEVQGDTAIEIGSCSDSEIYLPPVTAIADRAFVNCGSLRRVTVSTTVKEIGYRAFYNCVNLQEVTLYSNVEHIGKEAFAGCVSLRIINFYGTKEEFQNLFQGVGLASGITVNYK